MNRCGNTGWVILALAVLAGAQTAHGLDYYVRHGGSDGLAGTSWSTAWGTLQKALDSAPVDGTLTVINVQGSTGSQAYATCLRALPYARNQVLNLNFQGGWMDVDTLPVQSGTSVVRHATSSGPGIRISAGDHGNSKTVRINRFHFYNVTRAIELTADAGQDSSGIVLLISNTTVRAQNDGLYLSYPHTFNFGPCQIVAENVDVAAGLGGAGHALYIAGYWNGSTVRATSNQVSSLTSSNGCGASFSAINQSGHSATFSRTVIYGCSGNGIHLDAALPDWTGSKASNCVYATLSHCTVADNGGNGLHTASSMSGCWIGVTDSIFANNGGSGLNLEGPPGVYTRSEGYNVFLDDDILVSGTPVALAATTAGTGPLFYGRREKPDPWYRIGFKTSPAYRSATDGGHRGAYLMDRLLMKGTVVTFR